MRLSRLHTAWAAVELQRRAGRHAGLLLLLAAAANLVMVITRVLADADQPTLAESLAAIAESQVVYGMTGAARLASGILLAGAALYLWKAWAAPLGIATLAVILLVASGAITAVSGGCALVLAAAASGAVDDLIETVAYLRQLTGSLGFAMAGLGLVAVALRRVQPGDPHRLFPPAALAIGIAMQFIWVDAATLLHRIVGAAFFLWLLAAGIALERRGANRGGYPGR
ncbi:MAG: hypothetical protein OYI31_01170 [Chloroflexota bacterium]|nr:hypothetical protein [Chloroflexota bacterium]MDE2941178.1 hypothetical protein [Chloroflexota bacterium]MDE3267057.1 hypothetical protein [Chloroflexota bacterium]